MDKLRLQFGDTIYEGTLSSAAITPSPPGTPEHMKKMYIEATLTDYTISQEKKMDSKVTAKIETSDGFVYEGVVESCVLEPNPYQTKQGLTVRLYPCKITYPTPKQIREGVIDECLAAVHNVGYDPEWTPGAVKGFIADAIRKLR